MNRVAAILVCGALVGCVPASVEYANSIDARLSVMEAKAAVAEQEASAMRDRLAAAEKKAGIDRSSAYLSAASTSYQIVDTNLVRLLAAFTSVTPAGAGSTVQLAVGNLNSMAFNGATITLIAYRAPKEGVFQNPVTVTHSHLGILAAGTWSAVSIPVPGVKPDELEGVSVSVSLDVVSAR